MDMQAAKTRGNSKQYHSVARHMRAVRFLHLGCHTAHSSVLTQKKVNGITLFLEGMERKTDFLDIDGAPLRENTNYHVATGGRTQKWTNGLFGIAGHYDDQSRRFWVLTALTQPHELT